MSVYVQCPYCDHPTVLRKVVEGRQYCCRQCNGFFVLRLAQIPEQKPEEQRALVEEQVEQTV